MDTIYTLTGGAWLANSLNAVAVLVSSATWATLLSWVSMLSVAVTTACWIQKRDVFVFLKWLVIMVFIPTLFIFSKKVRSNLRKSYQEYQDAYSANKLVQLAST